MAVTVSGKLVVIYTTESDIEKRIEVLAKDIEISDPEIQDEDRGMGPKLVYAASANAEHLGDMEWLIYEYPVGVLNYVENPDIEGTVLQHPNFSITLD